MITGNFEQDRILRLGGQVRRYHTWPVFRQQTVGEHSHRVAVLLTLLDPNVSANLLKAALYHDLSEYVSGDVPSPFKWRFIEAKAALNEATTEIEHQAGIRVDLNKAEQLLLSFADMAELVLFSIEELRMGNREAELMVQRGLERLMSMDYLPTSALMMRAELAKWYEEMKQ